MNKILKRLLTGVLTLATVFTALPTTAVHAAETQYWTESEERVGIVEKVMNDGSMVYAEIDLQEKKYERKVISVD